MIRANSVGAVAGGYQAVKLGSMLTAEVSRIVNRKMSTERVYEALTDESKMEIFAKDVYAELPIHLKSKISLEELIFNIMERRKKLLKKKKNRKKIEAKKK